jgi:hypothetical protein
MHRARHRRRTCARQNAATPTCAHQNAATPTCAHPGASNRARAVLLAAVLVASACGDADLPFEAGIEAWPAPAETPERLRYPRRSLAPPLPLDEATEPDFVVVVEIGVARDDRYRLYWTDGAGEPPDVTGPGNLRIVRRFETAEAARAFSGTYVVERDGERLFVEAIFGGGCDAVADLGYDPERWRVAVYRFSSSPSFGGTGVRLSCARRMPPERPRWHYPSIPSVMRTDGRLLYQALHVPREPLHLERDGRPHLPDEIMPQKDRAVISLAAVWPLAQSTEGVSVRWTVETGERRWSWVRGFDHCRRAGVWSPENDVRFETGHPYIDGVTCHYDDGSDTAWIY